MPGYEQNGFISALGRGYIYSTAQIHPTYRMKRRQPAERWFSLCLTTNIDPYPTKGGPVLP